MEESSVCLVRSLSQPSPTSEEKEGNPLHRALTTSISFGRFMSESLDWVKWSAFTQNRYMEEVEKYSKPGSVAEKKAYFEAHFKRRRAAALLEQQNAAASNATASEFPEANAENRVQSDGGASSDLNFRAKESCVVTENANHGEISSGCTAFKVGQNVSCVAVTERTIEDSQPGGVMKLSGPPVLMENPVELTNQPGNDGGIDDTVSKMEDRACNKDDSTMRNSSSCEKKSGVSTNVSSASKCVPSPPRSPCFKPIISVQLKNSDKTPDSKENVRGSGNKRRSYTTSIHMSINLASRSCETQKAALPAKPKVDDIRFSRAPAKKFKNCKLSQTSTTASVNGIFKHHGGTTLQANRMITINGDSNSQSRMVEVQSLSKSCSKFSKAFGSKARPPTVASPFTFKSEERAAKRREKLEQKLKSMETETQQTHAKPQVKRRDNFKDLCTSSAIRATKNAVPSPTTDFSNNLAKKVPTVKPCLPKVEERASFKVQDNNSRPHCRISVRKEGLNAAAAKNKCLPVYNNTRCSKISMSENSSPNIQL